ncbi:MAG: hypothetical protein HY673_15225 [Chloroflexi bacterium]|nr:hypothetical protein [Chloroflexota bacterium]
MQAKPGYTGKIARVDLSTGAVSQVPTGDYADAFVGGQGVAARIYWDEVPAGARAFDPENRLIFATGPCAGVQGLSGARWVVCGKSPATTPEFFTHSNLGGSWGAELKAAGFDCLVVQGNADRPVYLLVRDGEIKIADASGLWGQGALQVREIIKAEQGSSFKVAATGQGGENMTCLATLLADNDSSGTGSLGAVMGSKNLKAVAVRGSGAAGIARPGQLQGLLERVAALKKDYPMTDSGVAEESMKDHCAGCTDECNRGLYEAGDGSRGKFMCQSGSFYKEWALSYYKEPNDVPFYATRLCNDYSLNTKSVFPIIAWLHRCHEAGLLSEKSTGLPLGKIGSLEFIQALTENIALRRGFGDVLAQGLHRAACTLGNRGVDLVYDDITKAGERMTYVPKAYLTTGLLYALDPRQPIQQLHEISRLGMVWVLWAKNKPGANLSSAVLRAIGKRAWGSELAADFSTYDGKALAAKMVQERQLAKECLILCDNAWPILYAEHTPDHLGDPSMESKIASAITGRDMAEDDFYRLGERLFNLQRAILLREGHRGKQDDTLPEACYELPLDTERLNPDCLLPGKDGEIISRKGAFFDRQEFQRMLREYYELRGWDVETGLHRKARLDSLGLGDVARDLAAEGLLGG